MSLRGAAARTILLLGALAAFGARATRAAPGQPEVVEHDAHVRVHLAGGTLAVTDHLTVVRNGGGELRLTLNAGLAVREVRLDGRAAVLLGPADGDEDRALPWLAVRRVRITPGPGPSGHVEIRYDGPLHPETPQAHGVVGGGLLFLDPESGWLPRDGGHAVHGLTVRGLDGLVPVASGALDEDDPGVRRFQAPLAARGAWLLGVAPDEDAGSRRPLRPVVHLGFPAAGPEALALRQALETAVGPPPGGSILLVHPGLLPEGSLATTLGPGTAVIGPDHPDPAAGVARIWFGAAPPAPADRTPFAALPSYLAHHLTDGAGQGGGRRRLRAALGGGGPTRTTVSGTTVSGATMPGHLRDMLALHALRLRVGDEAFLGAVRAVLAGGDGRPAPDGAWARAMERASGQNLGDWITQWRLRPDLPVLELEDAVVENQGGRLRVVGRIRQRLPDGVPPWRIDVPVEVEHLTGVVRVTVACSEELTGFAVRAPSLPLRITADPEYEVPRVPAPEDVPPCLLAALRRPDVLIVSGAAPGTAAARLADALAEDFATGSGGTPVPAAEAPDLPPARRSLVIVAPPPDLPLLANLRASRPALVVDRSPGRAELVAVRSPADAAEFVVVIDGDPEGIEALARPGPAHLLRTGAVDERVEFLAGLPTGRTAARRRPGPTCTALLPAMGSMTSDERARRLAADLTAARATDGVAGVRRRLTAALVEAGLDVDEQAFSFVVRTLPAPSDGEGGEEGDGRPDARPLAASPVTPQEGIPYSSVTDLEGDVRGAAVRLRLPAALDDPDRFVRDAAAMAADLGAVALLLDPPASGAGPRIGGLLARALADDATPQEVADEAARQEPALRRGLLPLPTLLVAAGQEIEGAGRVRAALTERSLAGRNLSGSLAAHRGSGPPLCLLTPFPEDEAADAVAAGLVEAVQMVAANRRLLGRDLHLVLLDRHRHGRHGLSALRRSAPDAPRLLVTPSGSDGTIARVAGAARGAEVLAALCRLEGLVPEVEGDGEGEDEDGVGVGVGVDSLAITGSRPRLLALSALALAAGR